MAASAEGLLKAEISYYDEHTEELLLTYPNRFVLIHGDQLIGDFESRSDAVAEGVRRYGRGPFLVRRTGDKQRKFTVFGSVSVPTLNFRAEEIVQTGRTIA